MLKDFADVIVYNWLQAPTGSMLGEALDFFFYDTMKVFLLLVSIIFAVAVIRSYFPPERSRKLLGNRREYVGNFLAASLGIVTPFCSCSAVPMFIGFVESGLPLGVTFSFLISSPTVNEVALVMLWGLFGWKIAMIYMGTGLIISFIGGIVIGKLKLEHLVEDYVYKIKMGETAAVIPTLKERLEYARDYTKDILKRVWLFVLLGIGLGAWIHGYVPMDFVLKYAGPGQPLRGDHSGVDRHPLIFQRGRDHPHYSGSGGKGDAHGDCPGFHDVHCGHLHPGDDHFAQSYQAQTHCDFCGNCIGLYCYYRLSFQRHSMTNVDPFGEILTLGDLLRKFLAKKDGRRKNDEN